MSISNPLISVIVPVYNAGEFLNECVDSILGQSFTKFELLLVDDGSTDNSPAICDEYAKKDNRVSVIHQTNGGASSARNCGIEKSVGDYIIFIDSDDYLSIDMFEKLITVCKDNDADMAVCGSTIIQTNGNFVTTKLNVSSFTLCDKDAAAKIIIEELNNALWNKIIKKSAIKNNRLELGRTFGEDYDFLIRVLNNCNTVCFIPDSLYYYRKNESSVTASKFTAKRLDQVYYRDKVHQFVTANFAHLADFTNAHRFLARLNICRHIYLSDNQSNYKSELNEYRRFMNQQYSCVKKYLNSKQKLEFLMFSMGEVTYKISAKFLFKR